MLFKNPSALAPLSKWIVSLVRVAGRCGCGKYVVANANGSDACYFNGSAYLPLTGVTGGTWIVGSITPGSPESQVVTPGHNQWGPDLVGYNPGPVRYYQQNRARLGLGMPCGFGLRRLHSNVI
jgi:hypothetical protein